MSPQEHKIHRALKDLGDLSDDGTTVSMDDLGVIEFAMVLEEEFNVELSDDEYIFGADINSVPLPEFMTRVKRLLLTAAVTTRRLP